VDLLGLVTGARTVHSCFPCDEVHELKLYSINTGHFMLATSRNPYDDQTSSVAIAESRSGESARLSIASQEMLFHIELFCRIEGLSGSSSEDPWDIHRTSCNWGG